MGAKNTKGKFGLEKEILDLVKQTKFTEEQVRFDFLGEDRAVCKGEANAGSFSQ